MIHDTSAAIVKTLERLMSEWSGVKLVGNQQQLANLQLGLGRLSRRPGADRERQQQQDAGSSIFSSASVHEGKIQCVAYHGRLSKHK